MTWLWRILLIQLDCQIYLKSYFFSTKETSTLFLHLSHSIVSLTVGKVSVPIFSLRTKSENFISVPFFTLLEDLFSFWFEALLSLVSSSTFTASTTFSDCVVAGSSFDITSPSTAALFGRILLKGINLIPACWACCSSLIYDLKIPVLCPILQYPRTMANFFFRI